MNAETQIVLAPPGAGLPKVELIIARMMFWSKRVGRNRDRVNADFQAERKKIRELVNTCDPDSMAKRVLIKRVPGIEDSSRHWSVLMTLDHLRIIHLQIRHTVKSLASGRVPEGQVSTAAVKPSPEVSAEVIGEYEASCDRLLATVAGVADLRTRIRYAHPWFGPLDAAGWHAMAATHLAIHRVQIERIMAGVGEC
jgi:hypothetical protein